MLQFQCIRMAEVAGSSLVQVSFELLLNGEPTSQRAVFFLQPDYCELGEVYNLTAQDFDESITKRDLSQLDDSVS